MEKKKNSVKQREFNTKAQSEISKKLGDPKHTYLCHHWEIENDKVKWKNILQSTDTIGPIFHMGFSENISGISISIFTISLMMCHTILHSWELL